MQAICFIKSFFFVFILIFLSCTRINKSKPAGFEKRKIILRKNLATVTIDLPARLDVYTSWSEDGYFRRDYYRYHDDNYPMKKDWIGKQPSSYLDSIYQFTIRQTGPLKKDNSLYNCFTHYDSLYILGKESHPTEGSTDYYFREFKMINNQWFKLSAVTVSIHNSEVSPTIYVTGKTCFKDYSLEFFAQCRGKDTTGFVQDMYKSILSIKINER